MKVLESEVMSASQTGKSSTLLYEMKDIEIVVRYDSDWSPSLRLRISLLTLEGVTNGIRVHWLAYCIIRF